MGKIDAMDMKILDELIKDSSLSIPKLSDKIDANPSVVYSRIKRLIKRGIIKTFTIIVNEEILGYGVIAVIGAEIDARQRGNIIDELLTIKEVRNVSEVTGRFDLLIKIQTRSMDELYTIISDNIGKISGILHTETFIEMNRRVKEPIYSFQR
ncbi:MAG: Lrp/AsnC family transcriptional regulator [Candidatus Methylarchaceae archaeon HK01B]|nr:Lrp/AsnC family transcriptional regulator [Candidatus Methylarchaceae archaeon HK01M]MCP8312612.1 Lrp/AsnC family transcriptional regulator [Candidatus Methylarchaceae archaeon HK02M1]MCP8318600.1 Lrp/AsnC family transcriptional regulator [Candidatus Methylarchaceae archaeon HK01B]